MKNKRNGHAWFFAFVCALVVSVGVIGALARPAWASWNNSLILVCKEAEGSIARSNAQGGADAAIVVAPKQGFKVKEYRVTFTDKATKTIPCTKTSLTLADVKAVKNTANDWNVVAKVEAILERAAHNPAGTTSNNTTTTNVPVVNNTGNSSGSDDQNTTKGSNTGGNNAGTSGNDTEGVGSTNEKPAENASPANDADPSDTGTTGAVRTLATPVNTEAKTTFAITLTDDGHGTAKANPAQSEKDKPVAITATPSAGYKFKAWTDVTDGVTLGDTTSATATFTMPEKEVSAKATFDPISYTVEFAKGADDVTGTMAAQTFAYDEAKALAANAFARTGYVFAGWKGNDDKTYTDAQQVSNLAATDGAKVTLTAQWKKALKVTFTKNATDATGSMSEQAVVSGEKTALTANAFARTGYVFGSWNTKADGTGTSYDDKAEVTLDADTTLYAQWKQLHTITFDKNAADATGTMAAQSVVSGEAAPLTANAYARAGYTFEGWNTLADGSGTVYTNQASIAVAADTTLYAQWKLITHTVTFDAHGGSGTMEAQVAAAGSKATLAENTFERKGYSFVGWNTAADGKGTAYADKAEYSFDADGTLFAQWVRNPASRPEVSTSAGSKFISRTTPVTYTISQKVHPAATYMRMWFDLDDAMNYATAWDKVAVKTADGEAIANAKVSIDGQRLQVVIEDATLLQDQIVQVVFAAKVRDNANLNPYLNNAGSTATIPYQAHTEFRYDDNSSETLDSVKEHIKIAVNSGNSSKTTTKKKTSGLAKTGDATSVAAVATLAGAGAAALVAGGRKRRA